MSQEPNLFGEMQERPNPKPESVRVRFKCGGPECEGICLLEPHELEEENPIKIKVIEWIEEPDWMLYEMGNWPRDEMWIVPAYECEVEP